MSTSSKYMGDRVRIQIDFDKFEKRKSKKLHARQLFRKNQLFIS